MGRSRSRLQRVRGDEGVVFPEHAVGQGRDPEIQAVGRSVMILNSGRRLSPRRRPGSLSELAVDTGCVSAVSRFAGSIETEGNIPTVGASGINVVEFRIMCLKYSNGMPIRYVAFPVSRRRSAQVGAQGYVEGKDLLSGKPMMQAIIDGLTQASYR